MTLGSLVLGLMVLGLGFLMMWRARWFREYIGNLGDLLDYPQVSWLDWSFLGAALMIVGFLIITGLLQLILASVFGALLQPSIG